MSFVVRRDHVLKPKYVDVDEQPGEDSSVYSEKMPDRRVGG